MDELLARIRVALRHASHLALPAIVETGDLRIDLSYRTITRGEQPIHLTPNEYRLLAVLARHLGKPLTHTELLVEVWGPSASNETHYLRVYFNQLRQKLEPDPSEPRYLRTEPGVGYRLMKLGK